MHKISKRLYKRSSGWVTLISLVIFLFFVTTVLPQQADTAEKNTGSTQSPDTSFSYSPDDLYHMAEAYGASGRQAYIRARFTFDLIFPLVYTAFLITAISWLLKRVLHPDNLGKLINLAPIFGMVFDYLENGTASLVMARYPVKTPLIASLAPVFTILKWIFIGGSFIILLGGILSATWKWVVPKIKKQSR